MSVSAVHPKTCCQGLPKACLFCLLISICAAQAIDGPLTPEESLKYLKTEPGLKVELVAAEPMVVDPVAVAWDEKGRMFVVEGRGYPIGPGKGKPPVGQVVMLEASKGDGHYDKRTVYADGLTFPNGVMPWKGGIYVTCAPYLYYFKDTQGDGKADVKQIVFKGFQDLSTTQLRVSHPILNLDNWVYFTSGLTAAKVLSTEHPDRPAVFLNRVDGRFRPGTDDIEPNAGTAQFGQTFDRFGGKFICSNRNHIQQVMLQLHYLKRNPNFSVGEVVEDISDHGAACRVYPLSANITTAAAHTGYITSACGIMIYEGTGLPAEYRGNSFMCEPAGNLVHRDVISHDGVAFTARRAYPTNEFLASPDNWFRPVNLATGPDGALYVCDMYRKTIEHPEYLPEATRKVTDFESGKTMGRIYRVVGEGSGVRGQDRSGSSTTTVSGVDLAKMNVKELCAELGNSNVWWRMTAQRLLLERQDTNVVPYLRFMCKKAGAPESRVHALRTLDGLGALIDAEIELALADRSAGVREHGLQLAEERLGQVTTEEWVKGSKGWTPVAVPYSSQQLASRLLVLADDTDPRVRFQCALSLGALDDDRIIPALVKIATQNLDDRWTRSAVLTSIGHREESFFAELLHWLSTIGNRPSPPPSSLPLLMADLGRILAAALPRERLVPSLNELLTSDKPADLSWQMAAVGGFGDGLRARGLATKQSSPMMSLASEDSSNLSQRLHDLFHRAAETALAEAQPLEARLAAISLLGQSDYASAGKMLQTLIAPRQASELQTAAMRALSQMASPEIGPALVKHETWNAYTPAVRDVALSVLTSNTNLLDSLLTAIESGDVPPATVNADRRMALMKHKDEIFRARAVKLFKDLEPGDRMKAYEASKPVLALKGDGKNGRAMFQKLCAACHVFAGEGHTVGPDLTGIRNQPSEVLLLHIVVPEYEIMPIYTCYNVELKEGEMVTGLLAAETPSTITLRMAQGVEQKIPRSEIASMMTSRLSLMPQELEKAMSPQELSDLLAFLKGE